MDQTNHEPVQPGFKPEPRSWFYGLALGLAIGLGLLIVVEITLPDVTDAQQDHFSRVFWSAIFVVWGFIMVAHLRYWTWGRWPIVGGVIALYGGLGLVVYYINAAIPRALLFVGVAVANAVVVIKSTETVENR